MKLLVELFARLFIVLEKLAEKINDRTDEIKKKDSDIIDEKFIKDVNFFSELEAKSAKENSEIYQVITEKCENKIKEEHDGK